MLNDETLPSNRFNSVSEDKSSAVQQLLLLDEDADEKEIEFLLEKSKLRFGDQKLWNDNKLPKANIYETVTENSEASSDEEFYIHKALLPLRKSKSSGAADFLLRNREDVRTGTQKSIELTNSTIMKPNLSSTEYNIRKSSLSASSANSSLSNLQPEGSCWSAPGGFSQSESDSTSQEENESDLETFSNIIPGINLHTKKFQREKWDESNKFVNSPSLNVINSRPVIRRTESSWSSPSKLYYRKHELKSPKKSSHELSSAKEMTEKKESFLDDKMSTTESSDEDEQNTNGQKYETTDLKNAGFNRRRPSRVFLAYESVSKLPTSKSDSQIIWYHAPPPKSTKILTLTNNIPHSATYHSGVNLDTPIKYRKSSSFQNQSIEQKRYSMPITKMDIYNQALLEHDKEAIINRSTIELKEEIPESKPTKMKTKKSSFALDYDLAAQIPMADEPFNHFNSADLTINYKQNYQMSLDNEVSEINYEDEIQQRYRYIKSPPMASADELTDSEISDLEKKVASGEIFMDRTPLINLEKNQIHDDLNLNVYSNIIYSTSMPTFLSNNILPINPKVNQNLENEETIKNYTMSQIYSYNKPSTHLFRSATMMDDRHNKKNVRHRRILPVRPDERQLFCSEIVNKTSGVEKSDESVIIYKNQRRLPQIPNLIQQQTFGYLPTDKVYLNMLETKEEKAPLMAHDTPGPSYLSGQMTCDLLPNNKKNTKEYQLSYGMDSIISSDVFYNPDNRKQNKYGLMEDSYYEDGLNGNNMSNVQNEDFIIPNQRILQAHNPTLNQRNSFTEENSSGISSCCTSSSSAVVDGNVARKTNAKNAPTHRAQFAFVPRHNDEILLEIGDALRVEKSSDDHCAHICEIDIVDEICQDVLAVNLPGYSKINKEYIVLGPIKQERDTFYLTMLASIEVAHHKGNDVLIQAINKVIKVVFNIV